MEVVAHQGERLHLGVGDLDAKGIGTVVQLRPDLETLGPSGRANEVDDGLVIDEGPSAPVLGDVAEQTMLDLVPLRGSRR